MDLNASWPAVSQICNLICLPSIFIMRAPNSTPMVKSWTGWNLLSVNWRSRHDFPTPINTKSKSVHYCDSRAKKTRQTTIFSIILLWLFQFDKFFEHESFNIFRKTCQIDRIKTKLTYYQISLQFDEFFGAKLRKHILVIIFTWSIWATKKGPETCWNA